MNEYYVLNLIIEVLCVYWKVDCWMLLMVVVVVVLLSVIVVVVFYLFLCLIDVLLYCGVLYVFMVGFVVYVVLLGLFSVL